MKFLVFICAICYYFNDSSAFFGLPVNPQFALDVNVNLKLLSKSLSANLPIIVKIVPLRESIKAGLPVQKYDWINVQEYITIYKAFVDKLALYVVDTKGNTQAMKDDVYFDLGVLATLTTNYTASVTKLDAFHNISMSAIIALVDPSTLNSPFINVYTVINTLVGKVPPLSINDVNVALASLFSDQNTIKSLFYRLSLAYDRLPAQLNIALNQLTMLANMQTQFAGAASSFATGILAFGTQAKIQFTAFKQVFLKIMSDEYLLTRTAVTSIEAQLNAINDYSEIQINPQVIAAYEQFVVTHQARLKVANFTVNNALEGYYNFVLGFDYSDYAQLKSGYLEFRDTLLVILLSTSVPVVIYNSPIALNCTTVYLPDLVNTVKIASTEIVKSFVDISLALPHASDAFANEYSNYRTLFNRTINSPIVHAKYIGLSTNRPTKISLGAFVSSAAANMTANYELGLGIQTDAMANTVATYLNTLSNQLEATVGAAAQNLLSDFTFYMSLISKCIGIPIMS